MSQTTNLAQSYAPLDSKDLTFVVGTGRCGSTMISNIFRQHPEVLSLSEFFIALEDSSRFQEGILDGSQFWALLSAPNSIYEVVLRLGIDVPEFLYPISSTSRYNAETGVPNILMTSLPHLTQDYEALYDELQGVVSSFPPDRVEQHYSRLFLWLKNRFGCKICVERSGYSLPMVPSLARLFPDAKFVHIIRDGRECAMSMSRHYPFRLLATLALREEREDPSLPDEESEYDDWLWLLPEQFYKDVAQNEIPIEVFGHMWSTWITEGICRLSQLPEEQVFTITYEELVEHPQQNLKRLMTFVDPSLFNETWLHSAAALIQQKPLSWEKLAAHKRASLEAACQPGLEALIREGVYSEEPLVL